MNRLLFDGHSPANVGDLLDLDQEDALYYSPVLSHAGKEGSPTDLALLAMGRSLESLEDAAGGGDDAVGGGDNVSGPLNTLAEIASNLLLFLLIFGMSATVDMKNLRNQLHNKWAILTGVVMQFVLMPLLGYLTILVLKDRGFTDAMGITLLIVTASPGGSYSNWWCSLFNAELALSVCMTAISTVFAVVFLPANLLLYTHAAYGFSKEDDENILSNVDFKAIFISLAIVIIAIVSGLYASYRLHSPRFQLWSNRLGSISGILLIVFSAVISSTTGDKDDNDQEGGGTKLWDQTWAFYVGVAAPCVVGLVLANFFARMARLNPPEIVTVSVECCYQNVGIATSAAVAMFDDPQQRAEALCVPLFYGGVEAVVLGIYCIICWKLGMTKAPKDEKICVVLSKTYEIIEDESTHRSHNEGIEVEYHDADGAHVLGPTSPTGRIPRSDLEAGSPAPLPMPRPRPPRSRFDTADTFPENTPQPGGFHAGLLDRIVTFFNTGNGGGRWRRRQSSQQSLSVSSSSAANVLQQTDLSMGDLKKEGDKEDTTALPATRERTRTETTVLSSELDSSTFDENSVSGHFSPRGRVDGHVSGETSGPAAAASQQPSGVGLPPLNEE